MNRIPTNPDRPKAIRECYCKECGMIAPSWFHSDFILGHDGFTCIWCAFPDRAKGERPSGWGYVSWAE